MNGSDAQQQLEYGKDLLVKGNLEEAERTYRWVIAFADDIAWRGVGLNRLGYLYRIQGRLDEAEIYYRRGLEQAEQAGDFSGQAVGHNDLGFLQRTRGQVGEAARAYGRSLQLAERAGDIRNQIVAHNNLGYTYRIQGQFDLAESHHRRGLELAEESGDIARQSLCLNNLATLEQQKGRLSQSEELSRRSLDLIQEVDYPARQAHILNHLGTIYRLRGRLVDAESAYKQSLALAERSGQLEDIAQSFDNLGQIYRLQGKFPEAIDAHQKAISLAAKVGFFDRQALHTNNLAIIRRLQERYEEAIALHQQAIELAEAVGDVEKQALIQADLAATWEFIDTHQARNSYALAIDHIEKIRAGFSRIEDRQGFFTKYADSYVRMVFVCLKLGEISEAFEYAERGRSRAFLDALGSVRQTLEQSVPAAEMRTLDVIRGQIDQLLAQSEHDRHRGSSTRSRQRTTDADLLTQLYDRFDREIRRLAVQYPDFGTLQTVTLADIGQIQRYLRDSAPSGTAIVEFVLGDHEAAAFVLTGDRLQVCQELDVSPELVQAALFAPLDREEQHYRLEVDATHIPVRYLRELRQRLIDPLQDQGMLQGIERLWIVPTGYLHYIPWSALPRWSDNDRNRHTYLVEEYREIIVFPMASLLPHCQLHRERAEHVREQLYAVGNPDGTLDAAGKEAAFVAEYYPEAIVHGPGTSREMARLASQNRGVLHFAQHAVLEASSQIYSGLEFHDGRVTIFDLLTNWQLTSEWVILAACHSGQGPVLAGDEISALTRSFIHAGAASVTASLYTLSDTATPELMRRVHAYRQGGMRAAEALAEGQRCAISEGVPERYWASFIHVGDA